MSYANPIYKTYYDTIQLLKLWSFIPCLTNIITSKESNFHVLNINEQHIASTHKDTFILDNSFVLRTHTTNFQNKCFTKYRNNINSSHNISFMNYGPVFRKDDSSRHSYFFHQIDGLMCGKHVNYYDSLILLTQLIKQILGLQYKLRIRKSYFPFTHPSFEIDVLINDEYIEILGCGMTTTNILQKFCIKNTQVFAFGMGIERIASIKYGILNIKTLRIL